MGHRPCEEDLTWTQFCRLSSGDCKPSEVKAFTADYLEKVLEPCDWLALWSTDIFDVLVEVSRRVLWEVLVLGREAHRAAPVSGAGPGREESEGVREAGAAAAVRRQRLQAGRGRHDLRPGGHAAPSPPAGAAGGLR